MIGRAERLRILLAEDTAINQRFAVRLLEKHGHTVVAVNNGLEAVEAHQAQRFDLVLMDIQMPEMDGLEATARIRAQEQASGTRTPIFAVTANALGMKREQYLAAGMDGYISKPILMEQFVQALAEVAEMNLRSTNTSGRASPAVSTMNKKVLLVDDELGILEGVRRGLCPSPDEWEMAFAGSREEGLMLLARQPFDVVVAGGEGDFLSEVRRRHPQSVRIALSDCADESLFSQPLAHQYLPKACDAETLRAVVERACALRHLLANEALRRLVSKMQSLPSLPALYLEILAELRSPDSSVKKVGAVVSRDLGITAKVLQVVNSALFGVQRRISNPVEAVNLLGLETVAALTLTIQVFSQAKGAHLPGFSPAALWGQALRVGKFAKLIAQAEGQSADVVQDAFTAGMLHDAGKLILAANQPEQYAEMLKLINLEGFSDSEAELEVFGTLHSGVGAYLLGLWGLPDPVVEAVAFHTRPCHYPAQSFGPLTAVHVANALANELRARQRVSAGALDLDYLTKLKLTERLPVWSGICARAAMDEEQVEDNSASCFGGVGQPQPFSVNRPATARR
jgi:HD-like signal output (HDOD) protein/CheY-like chemotaxis protein